MSAASTIPFSLRQRNSNSTSNETSTRTQDKLDPQIKNEDDKMPVSALVGCRKCKERWEIEATTEGKDKHHDARKYTVCDIAKHRTRESLWIHAKGSVFDVTKFAHEHPGGDRAFMVSATGKACDDDYDFHSSPAKSLWYKFKIGSVIQCDAEESLKHLSACIVV